MQLIEAEKEQLRLEEHQVVIADVVRGEVCEEWRSVIGQMADEHEVCYNAFLSRLSGFCTPSWEMNVRDGNRANHSVINVILPQAIKEIDNCIA